MKDLWQTLPLSPETPREASLLTGLDLSRGLRGWIGFGWFAFVGVALAPLAILLIPGPTVPIGPIVFSALVLLGIGLGFLHHARQQLLLRRSALLQGQVVEGSIIRQGKQLNVFSSSPHTTLTVHFLLPEGQQNATGILFRREALRDLPKGGRVLGLWLPAQKQIWLPLEIGVQLQAEPLELAEVPVPDVDAGVAGPEAKED